VAHQSRISVFLQAKKTLEHENNFILNQEDKLLEILVELNKEKSIETLKDEFENLKNLFQELQSQEMR
ncbi:MAG: hypothetical protein K2X39_01920, partial [Silvanigrellaceae bacterium]|nr:hypothetical protein [Silvanigrellaceae bacterium]